MNINGKKISKQECPNGPPCQVLTAAVVDQLMFYSEQHNLLPAHHFGGRLGCTTTDAVHLLAHTIKGEWHQKNIISVLFLDVEVAFPNAIPEWLIHNLLKWKIPKRYINFVEGVTTKVLAHNTRLSSAWSR